MKFENKEVEKMYYELHNKYQIHSTRRSDDTITYETIEGLEELFKSFDLEFK